MINAERLVELRGERSQREIEDATGVPQAALSRYENGEAVRPDLKKLRKLAEYYGVELREIWDPHRRVKPKARLIVSGDDAPLQELVLTWSELGPDLREELLQIAQALLRIERRRQG